MHTSEVFLMMHKHGAIHCFNLKNEIRCLFAYFLVVWDIIGKNRSL